MAERWMLSRAGIVNVYQYGEEVLRFGGGRLLLRGVNGSGKSTAMNMLLPFLLDADVRRIDAAGEQAGVLRSWMLSGRDETQPTGYLWLELARGDDHLAFGCGIKANRNTDNVNHWWFLTDRRPGIDLELVRTQGRVRTPLSAEELRTELGTAQVWSKEQRSAYRSALRERLYGGADLDQHLRLLHIVRNPRVGDKVDVDLPQHLHDALPQLSETAIDDAATPLEQLEEHRRNVTQLGETVTTLDALVEAYRAHARSELHHRVEAAGATLDRHRAATRQAAEADAELTAATAEARARAERTVALDATVRRLTAEIEQLQASDAYRAVTELDARRDRLASLARELEAARGQATDDASRAGEAATGIDDEGRAVSEAARRADEDAGALTGSVSRAGLEAVVPARAEVAVAALTVAGDVVAVPSGPFDEAATDARAGLAAVRHAAQARRAEVAEAGAALDQVDAAAAALATEARRLDAAARQVTLAAEALTTAAGERTEAARAWRVAARGWVDDLGRHLGAAEALGIEVDADALATALDEADVVADHREQRDALLAAVDAVLRAHERHDATLAARQAHQQEERDSARQRVEDLARRTEPEPPAAPWQATRLGPCLAEVIDFAAVVDDAERAGLEAALEAAGLLVAEVRGDGALAVGDLLLVPGPATASALERLVTVLVPETARGRVDERALTRVLAGISTDPGDLDAPDGPTTVTTTGEFRLGPLRGRHHKEAAEHIGVTARRARLERLRAEAAAVLAEAERALAATVTERRSVAEGRDGATRLRAALPATDALVTAIARADQAARRRTEAGEEHEAAETAHRQADDLHARRIDAARRTCATLRLPPDRDLLAEVDEACRDVPSDATALDRSLGGLAAAVRRWSAAGARWADLRRAADRSARRARAKDEEHRQEAAELATLEDAIGLDARELVATLSRTKQERDGAAAELEEQRQRQGPADRRVGDARAAARTAADRLEAATAACGRGVETLQAAMAVPGLVGAAVGGPDARAGDDGDVPDLPAVPASPDGLRTLVRAVQAVVSAPAVETGADSVRAAIRQRRDALGAGWDAVDRQPDPDLPLAVEVNGPLGRMPLAEAATLAASELATKQGLLSAQQDQALRNLLQGLIAKEVAEKLHAARELVDRVNERLHSVRTTHGIGVTLRWRRADDLDDHLTAMVDLLARPPDLRTPDDDARLVTALSARLADARRVDPEADYRALIARVLDYRAWHRMHVVVHRPGAPAAVLGRRTPLSEGEKKIVSYQPLFAAVAASCDGLAEHAPEAPRFVLLDDAFAKVSEDNHPKLFGLLVDLDLDFIATSERLWGTHATVPELAITEVVRDAEAGVIVLEHAHWDGRTRVDVP